MKTLCMTLGLLLLVFCCCNSMPSGVQDSMAPIGNCCSEFSSLKIPIARVTSIIKTDKSCLKKGFIVTTVRKRRVCYSSKFDWTLKLFNQFYNTEGSS